MLGIVASATQDGTVLPLEQDSFRACDCERCNGIKILSCPIIRTGQEAPCVVQILRQEQSNEIATGIHKESAVAIGKSIASESMDSKQAT